MVWMTGYSLDEKLYESVISQIFRAKKAGGLPVVLKILKDGAPSGEALRYKNEYKLLQKIRSENAINVHDLIEHEGRPVLVFEDFRGEPLGRYLKRGPSPIEESLRIGVKIAKALNDIHEAHIIHKAVHPENILVNPTSGRLKVIDFGVSTPLAREFSSPESLSAGGVDLLYISPEQTGRMNRSLDFRTDFYSLGVLLYELLTGRLPFDAGDPMKLIHAHIAKTPVAPQDINPAVPGTLSGVIGKLMRKNAEERYQSAAGIIWDLEKCLRLLRETGAVADFPIAENDVSETFRIPEKLYGRETETGRLAAIFPEVSSGGKALVFFSGPPGIGKSVLINEIQKSMAQTDGFFISGKFDRLKRDIPYNAILQAFRGLTRQLMGKSEAEFIKWRERISKALGGNGGIITDAIPEMEMIIGKQPAVQPLSPAESQNRFHLVFQNFVSVFAGARHPLVLSIDDLQWADQASLQLLEMLLTDRSLNHFLFIGAYRDNEVDAVHPFKILLESLQDKGLLWEDIRLSPISGQDIRDMLADTLGRRQNAAEDLSRLVLRKTGGNPFFVKEFLITLHRNGLLWFKGGWAWDIEKIRQAGITDNVVALMADGIVKLPEKTLNAFKTAACIGVRFELQILALVSGDTEDAAFDSLLPAIDSGMLLKIGSGFRFVHDRVLEAAYSLLDEAERTRLHYRAGNLMLAAARREGKVDERVFDIANHLNRAGVLLKNDEKKELAEINLKAGQKAKASAAYETAALFLARGAELLSPDAWDTDYDLTLSLYVEWAEAEYVSTYFEEAERLFDITLNHAKHLLDKIRIHMMRIFYYESRMNHEESIRVGREAAAYLGLELPENPGQLEIIACYLKTRLRLSGKKTEELGKLPQMSDPEQIALLRILSSIGPSVYNSNPNMTPILIMQAFHLILKHGIDAYTPFIYSAYGFFIAAAFNEIGRAYELGKLSIQIGESAGNKLMTGRAYLHFSYIAHYKEPLNTNTGYLRKSAQLLLEDGDILYGGYAYHHMAYTALFAGKPIDTVRTLCDENAFLLQKLDQHSTGQYLKVWRQSLDNLAGSARDPLKIEGPFFSEEKDLPVCRESNDTYIMSCFYIIKTIILFLYEKYPEALRICDNDQAIAGGLFGQPPVNTFQFFHALALAAAYPPASGREKKVFWKKLKQLRKKFKLWSEHGPYNYRHKYHLICAEMANIKGKHAKAETWYDAAAAGASENGFIHEEAVAWECAAKFHLSTDRKKAAQKMAKAIRCYRTWGARRKARDLENRYSDLPGLADSAGTPSLDFHTVIKATQAISGEIDLENLLSRIMTLVIENAGARKGFLLMEKEGNLVIEAEIDAAKNGLATPGSRPPEDSDDLSLGVVRYSDRTGEIVLLNNAAAEERFSDDPYIARHKPGSILCMPLVAQGGSSGVLYLENRLARGAFTPDRIEILKILSAQAAISIRNAYSVRKIVENEARLRKIIEKIPIPTVVIGKTHDIEYVNDQFTGRFGYTALDIPNEDRFWKVIGRPRIAGMENGMQEVEITVKDQTTRCCECYMVPLDDFSLILLNDITDRKAAEKEKAELESQIQQARKMESIGQLAGGVAHDFNNMLGAIIGHAELAMMNTDSSRKSFKNLKEILKAAERSADLTRQLLAFARKQPISPKTLDINKTVSGMITMLKRLIGEHIDLVWRPKPDLWPVLADPSQIDQILINLCVNARDAIADIGKITIETGTVDIDEEYCAKHAGFFPGAYVLLAVSDNGCGMTRETLDHIYEPFFTTKTAVGGTGLGLATVYGVVKQNNGFINVYSEPSRGTSFKIYLPRLLSDSDHAPVGKEAVPLVSGVETILVVEDEPGILEMTREMLESHGYTVLAASTPDEAQRMAATHVGEIRLLLTDVIMPEMNGLELAERLKSSHPNLAVLYMSGYTANVIAHHGILDEGVFYIQKPFFRDDLARKVREVLS